MSDAPRRDKFAAMAQRQQQAPEPSPAPKRDKFAAIAARSGTASSTAKAASAPRRDKFSALAASPTTRPPTREEIQQREQEEKVAKLEARAQQRQDVWQDLARAEGAIVQLLSLAEQTTARLAETKIDDELSELAEAYSKTLADIHAKLSPHADLLVAYQFPTRTNRMYLARVEQRLADQKRELLKELKSLEEEQEPSSDEVMGGEKRKRED